MKYYRAMEIKYNYYDRWKMLSKKYKNLEQKKRLFNKFFNIIMNSRITS